MTRAITQRAGLGDAARARVGEKAAGKTAKKASKKKAAGKTAKTAKKVTKKKAKKSNRVAPERSDRRRAPGLAVKPRPRASEPAESDLPELRAKLRAESRADPREPSIEGAAVDFGAPSELEPRAGTLSNRDEKEVVSPIDSFFLSTEESADTRLQGLGEPPAGVSPEAGFASSDDLAILRFRMEKEWFGLPIESLREIVQPITLTPIPRSSPFIRGVVSLRGSVIPVYDMHSRMALVRPGQGRLTRLLVVGEEGDEAGFEVDEVSGVWRPERLSREAAPSSLGARAEFIECLLREEDSFLILLALESCLALPPSDARGSQ